jgi:uncharacterized protein (DUF1330 family)
MPPKGYWVAQGDVHDPEIYALYRDANAAPFARFGAKFLIRGAPQQQVEGASRARTVVIEFPSLQAALECYHSPEYQAAKAIREPISEVDLVILEGYEG